MNTIQPIDTSGWFAVVTRTSHPRASYRVRGIFPTEEEAGAFGLKLREDDLHVPLEIVVVREPAALFCKSCGQEVDGEHECEGDPSI